MSKIDLINQGLIEVGFIIDGIEYSYQKEIQHNLIVNGVHQVHYQTQLFLMKYIGDGCEVDENHNDIEGTEFCGFDILDEEKYPVHTIFVDNIEQLRSLLRLW